MNVFNRTFIKLWTLDGLLMVGSAIGLYVALNYFGVASALPISILTFLGGLITYVYFVIQALKRWGYIGNNHNCCEHNEELVDECDEEPTEADPVVEDRVEQEPETPKQEGTV